MKTTTRKNKPIYIYRTDIRSSVFLFLMWMLIPLLALLPPSNFERFIKVFPTAFLIGFVFFIFLYIFSHINWYPNEEVVSFLLGHKKKTSVKDVIEIRRYPMYRGLSKVFGWQAAVFYKEDNGPIRYFEMSENLYSKRVMQDFFRKLVEMNKNIKLDPHYQKLLEKKTFRWYE